MKISARNTLAGKVVSIEEGAVNNEVVVELSEGVQVTSIITKKATADLGLTVGGEAFAIVKSSDVMLAVA